MAAKTNGSSSKAPEQGQEQEQTPAPAQPLTLTGLEGPGTRTLQITISQPDHVLLARLSTKWVEKGQRPSACTKSALIGAAIRKLAEVEGVQ